MQNCQEIVGYVEPWITTPGDRVNVKVSRSAFRKRTSHLITDFLQVSSTECSYTHGLVRLLGGSRHEDTSPINVEEVDDGSCPHHHDGKYQLARPGSYAIVENFNEAKWDDEEDLELELYAQPYLPMHDKAQCLVSTLDFKEARGFAVVLIDGRLQVWYGVEGGVKRLQTNSALNRWRWYHLVVRMNHRRLETTIEQLVRVAEPTPAPETVVAKLVSAISRGESPLLMASGLFSGYNHPTSVPYAFFNGRLDSPKFRITSPNPRLLASYDFTVQMSGCQIFDMSMNAYHGILFNAPTRAVKGHNWDGSIIDWTKDSSHYGAIHFHEDDLDDAQWDTDFTITIPSSCRSGFYAIWLRTSSGVEDFATFFVRPTAASTATVAFVAPTFTYLAYANERMYDQTKSSSMAVPEGTLSHTTSPEFNRMVQRADLGLSVYDVHCDGSPCVYSSSRRPILNLRPRYTHWALNRPRELSADLFMIGLLEDISIPYDVITDHCLHSNGHSLASRYTTLITGGHPEYSSLGMLDTYTSMAMSGANIMYLGGNGFYWATSVSGSADHRIEVRKGDQGCRSITVPPGERVHSVDGLEGGLWRSRGRAPNYLFGVGCCAFGTGKGQPYKRNIESARHPFAAIAFKGIPFDELVGSSGFGGGASGDEIDRFDLELGSPSNAVILATSLRHDETFGLFNEDQMFPMIDTLGPSCEKVRSDMIYYDTARGGSVFSVGSINWYSSLGWNNGRNTVATITKNVLKEFEARKKG